MKIAFSYIRFSTPEQLKGDSLRRQTKLAEEYAKVHKLTIDRKLNLRDLGVSSYRGTNATTGALGSFLEAIKHNKVPAGSVLLVENLDRLSRDQIGNSLELLLGIVRNGVEVVTLNDGRRYNSETINADPTALMSSLMEFYVAHGESKKKSIRLGAAWKAKRQKAGEKKLTARAPAWLKLREDKKSFEVVPGRAAVVQTIFKLTLEGFGKRAVALQFNKSSLKPWGKGNGWHESYIQKILTNRSVIGEYQPHHLVNGKREPIGDPIIDYYPSLVDPVAFDKIQKRSKRAVGGRIGARVTNLFSGLAEDTFTGYPMHYHDKGTKTRGNGKWRYLVSDSKRVGIVGSRVHYETFEKAFLQYVRHLDWQSIAKETHTNEKVQEIETQIFQAKEQLTRVRQSLTKLVKAMEDEDSPPKTIMVRIKELEGEQVQKEDALRELSVLQSEAEAEVNQKTLSDSNLGRLIENASDFESRIRLREEIRRKVKMIYIAGKYEAKTKGLGRRMKNPMLTFRVVFVNGVERVVVFQGLDVRGTPIIVESTPKKPKLALSD